MPSHRIRYIVFFLALIVPLTVFADENKFLLEADQAVTQKDYKSAEKLYSKALEQDPKNFRIMKSLAELKIRFKKWDEADKLLDAIIAMPVSTGRKVWVYMEGEPEAVEAELVDETVVAPPTVKDNMRNYVGSRSLDPVPQYRLFFKVTGKMDLVPKSQARIEYVGVPRRDYALASDMSQLVKKEIIARQGEKNAPVEMVDIKGGCFMMGSEKGHDDEKPVHEVCVDAFKMDKYEVTQSRFQSKFGSNPSQFPGANLPVDSVTWYEAAHYCKEMGKRLPTEAEWEFAVRGATKSEFYTGDTFTGKDANICDRQCNRNVRIREINDGYDFTAPVGSFPPNPYGLHDMIGNVGEWTADWMLENYYSLSPKDNPKGPSAGYHKVIRGGGWNNGLDFARSAYRKGFTTDFRDDGIGFRCVK